MTESPGKLTSDKNQLTASGAEVIFLLFLVAFGMGLCIWADRAFSLFYKEPTEQEFFGKAGIKEKQEKLTRLEDAIKEAEKQLDTVTLDRLKRSAELKSMEKLHPEIGKPGQGTATTIHAEVQKSYDTARVQQLAADEYADLLNQRITTLRKEAQETSRTLEPEKQAATKEFAWRRRVYLLTKFAVSFLLPLPVVLLALFVGARFFNRTAKRPVWISQGRLPALLVLCALLVLLAYQAFQIAGAVFIAIILFLILLRKISWSPTVEKEAKRQ
jgi:hypothetical protein